LDRNPCGSSSGTGAAIAANLAAIGVGTETDGSIVCPSGANGLVGIKPTVGLVSQAGIIPISHSQDTAGPMARTVADAALLLTAMRVPGKGGDYTRALKPDALKGARIGVARKQYFGYSDATDAVINQAIADMKAAGAVIVDPADIPTAAKMDGCEMEVLLYEFKADLNAYLNWIGPKSPVHSLKEIIAFNDAHKDREMPFFAQELMVKAEEEGPLTDAKYLAALAKNHRLSREQGIDAVMTAHKLDALIAPTSGPAWLIDPVNGDYAQNGATTAPAVAGYPHVTVPAGQVMGLPVGLSFIGRAWSEPALIRLAYAYEQATKHRVVPQFKATIDLGKR
jgi:amidase